MTQSGDPWTISGMKDLNARYEAPVRAFLEAIVRDSEAHARFMNMLSMLEHMGSRKIMVSHLDKAESLTEDTLKHLAEEARHAYFFKRQAERMAGRALDGYKDENTMCRIPSAMYFGRLDAGISKEVAADEAYPWVSMIVELRACWLYHIYHEVLDASDVQLSLKSLLAEEDQHLAEMFEMVGHNQEKLKALTQYETDLFAKLWQTLSTHAPLQEAA